ncbi:MAG: HNH endonuclease [Capsulimonadaceae bacterium]
MSRDGAHILPFAQFHDDDPKNGIALCKSHHLGFDRGWFSVSDRYDVVASPRVSGCVAFVREGERLRLPDDPVLAPAPWPFGGVGRINCWLGRGTEWIRWFSNASNIANASNAGYDQGKRLLKGEEKSHDCHSRVRPDRRGLDDCPRVERSAGAATAGQHG